MAIDPESELGQHIFAEHPIKIDPTQLSEAAGEIVVSRMHEKMSREEAVVRLANSGARHAADTVVVLDVNRLYDGRPELKNQVDALTRSGLTLGQAIGRLIVDGARYRTHKDHFDEGKKLLDAISDPSKSEHTVTIRTKVPRRSR